jgi:hypothetical protein
MLHKLTIGSDNSKELEPLAFLDFGLDSPSTVRAVKVR